MEVQIITTPEAIRQNRFRGFVLLRSFASLRMTGAAMLPLEKSQVIFNILVKIA